MQVHIQLYRYQSLEFLSVSLYAIIGELWFDLVLSGNLLLLRKEFRFSLCGRIYVRLIVLNCPLCNLPVFSSIKHLWLNINLRIYAIIGSNFSSAWSGSRETLVGAIFGFRHKYVLYWLLILKQCSRSALIILPNPKDGSMTLGIYFYSPILTIFCSNVRWVLLSLNYLSLILIVIPSFASYSAFNFFLSSSDSLSI